ncbi:hypothetical protein [Methylocystis sp. B8]|uniref:hypothetical protein n=1 Tax=Methylocystis sp. B8 TaxID=544938 RepID=UPI0010FD97D1|nr:hypothetical protein [Methylocystis sp. B8]TLG78946.1 hypothetical protein FEV16_02650 [Methylocystis sp. B8]
MILGAVTFLRALARLSILTLLFAASGAYAQSCQEDFQKLSEKRMAGIEALNNLGKAGKGKMDPEAACPAAKRLAAVETEMLNYLTKNKEWCNIPDNAVDSFKEARAKTQNFASQACSVAAKVKQQREQAAAGGGGMMAPPKLPAGPL